MSRPTTTQSPRSARPSCRHQSSGCAGRKGLRLAALPAAARRFDGLLMSVCLFDGSCWIVAARQREHGESSTLSDQLPRTAGSAPGTLVRQPRVRSTLLLAMWAFSAIIAAYSRDRAAGTRPTLRSPQSTSHFPACSIAFRYADRQYQNRIAAAGLKIACIVASE